MATFLNPQVTARLETQLIASNDRSSALILLRSNYSIGLVAQSFIVLAIASDVATFVKSKLIAETFSFSKRSSLLDVPAHLVLEGLNESAHRVAPSLPAQPTSRRTRTLRSRCSSSCCNVSCIKPTSTPIFLHMLEQLKPLCGCCPLT